MTVVINPLVTPLLFNALSQCSSARERALRLRALAEASLRQQLTGLPSQAPTLQIPAEARPAAQMASTEPDLQIIRFDENYGNDGAIASESLGDQFAAFF